MVKVATATYRCHHYPHLHSPFLIPTMAEHEHETIDVVICGCGPTGAMLSAYLGRLSVRHIVLEKEGRITTDPRGIALDEDGIRLLQGVGIYEHVYTDIGTCMQKFKFIGGTEKTLHTAPFLEMDYGTTEGGTGHVGFICHKQPTLEKHLRNAMASSEFCQLKSNCTVFEIREDENYTYCRYRDINRTTRTIRSRFFVGADGKTGFTRKNYLEPLGIHMEQAHKAFYDETWVALNWKVVLPTPTTHPDFPLWKLGFTPQQVYDLFFPTNFRFICNPERPAVCGRFGLPEDRLCRFEFVVRRDEDGDEMAGPVKIKEVVFPYFSHAGSHYGLSQDVRFPEDCIHVLRSRPFRFAARSCNEWFRGRVVLCGDAAHVFPPFGGQGIASGFRDAVSLSWRLALLTRQPTSKGNHTKVLSSWSQERKQQLTRSLSATIANGNFVTERNLLKIFLRDWYLYILSFLPSYQRGLRLGHRKEGMIRYEYVDGMPFVAGFGGGVCVPQVYVSAWDRGAEVLFSDDILFSRGKKGLFQVLVYIRDPRELSSAREVVSDVAQISNGKLLAKEATFIIETTTPTLAPETGDTTSSVYRLATAKEFADSPLCRGRPEPRYYNPYYLGDIVGRGGVRYVIVRPDRFVYASCDNKRDLEGVVVRLGGYLRA